MNLVERTRALLAEVDRYEAEHCAGLLDPAGAQAHERIRAALADARRRVLTAINEERARSRAEIGAAEAALATARRQWGARRAVSALAQARPALHSRLRELWLQPDSRRCWVAAHWQRAAHLLGGSAVEWQVRYEPRWSAAEREAVMADIASPARVEFVEDTRLQAGFVVKQGANVIDASVDGLLADGAAIDGRLLQLLETQ